MKMTLTACTPEHPMLSLSMHTAAEQKEPQLLHSAFVYVCVCVCVCVYYML
jgi:hypothetical protein